MGEVLRPNAGGRQVEEGGGGAGFVTDQDQRYNVEETEFSLYAFTVDDAKNMTQALIETLTKIAGEKLPPLLDEFVNERKQRMQESQSQQLYKS